MAFTIEEIALKNAVAAAQKKMNDILYAFKGNFTTIQNLSDIKYNFIDKTGKTYDSTKTYSLGDIISYNFYAYISLVNNNINNIPYENTTYWAKVETNTCLYGEAYAAALCTIFFPLNWSDPNSGTQPYLEVGHNIAYISYAGSFMWEVKFNDSIALSDSNYMVLIGGRNIRTVYEVSNNANIISKTKNSFIFKMPTNFTSYQSGGSISFAIVPLQNEDFQI